jgi:hypothetical protein
VVSNFEDRLQNFRINTSAGGITDFYIDKFINADQDFKANVQKADYIEI